MILNVSHNDKDEDQEGFVSGLEDFVAFNRERGIATIFSLEATSLEAYPGGLALHGPMREVAERLGVPVVDTHARLEEAYDHGFLWWDTVHPTSYGHRLIAEALAPAVRAVFETSE